MKKYTFFKVLLLFCFLGAVSISGYAKSAVLPKWVVSLKGEFLGISFPGGGQRQAELFALLSMSYSSLGSQSMHVNNIGVVNGCLNYEVRQSELLSTGETVVLLTVGSRSDSVRAMIQSYKVVQSQSQSEKYEFGMWVSGEEELYANVFEIDGVLSVLSKYDDKVNEMVRYWSRDEDGLSVMGYRETGVDKYRSVRYKGTYDKSVEMDMNGLYLSECFLYMMLNHTGLQIRGVSIRNGKLTLYS